MNLQKTLRNIMLVLAVGRPWAAELSGIGRLTTSQPFD
jgi:hypothetical protein